MPPKIVIEAERAYSKLRGRKTFPALHAAMGLGSKKEKVALLLSMQTHAPDLYAAVGGKTLRFGLERGMSVARIGELFGYHGLAGASLRHVHIIAQKRMAGIVAGDAGLIKLVRGTQEGLLKYSLLPEAEFTKDVNRVVSDQLKDQSLSLANVAGALGFSLSMRKGRRPKVPAKASGRILGALYPAVRQRVHDSLSRDVVAYASFFGKEAKNQLVVSVVRKLLDENRLSLRSVAAELGYRSGARGGQQIASTHVRGVVLQALGEEDPGFLGEIKKQRNRSYDDFLEFFGSEPAQELLVGYVVAGLKQSKRFDIDSALRRFGVGEVSRGRMQSIKRYVRRFDKKYGSDVFGMMKQAAENSHRFYSKMYGSDALRNAIKADVWGAVQGRREFSIRKIADKWGYGGSVCARFLQPLLERDAGLKGVYEGRLRKEITALFAGERNPSMREVLEAVGLNPDGGEYVRSVVSGDEALLARVAGRKHDPKSYTDFFGEGRVHEFIAGRLRALVASGRVITPTAVGRAIGRRDPSSPLVSQQLRRALAHQPDVERMFRERLMQQGVRDFARFYGDAGVEQLIVARADALSKDLRLTMEDLAHDLGYALHGGRYVPKSIRTTILRALEKAGRDDLLRGVAGSGLGAGELLDRYVSDIQNTGWVRPKTKEQIARSYPGGFPEFVEKEVFEHGERFPPHTIQCILRGFFADLKKNPDRYAEYIKRFSGGEESLARLQHAFSDFICSGVASHEVVKILGGMVKNGEVDGYSDVKQFKRAIDFCTGHNMFTKALLHETGYVPRTLALDHNPHMLERGMKDERVENRLADVEELSGLSPENDLASIGFGLEHLVDRKRLMENAHRSLKRGGVFVAYGSEPFSEQFVDGAREMGFRILKTGMIRTRLNWESSRNVSSVFDPDTAKRIKQRFVKRAHLLIPQKVTDAPKPSGERFLLTHYPQEPATRRPPPSPAMQILPGDVRDLDMKTTSVLKEVSPVSRRGDVEHVREVLRMVIRMSEAGVWYKGEQVNELISRIPSDCVHEFTGLIGRWRSVEERRYGVSPALVAALAGVGVDPHVFTRGVREALRESETMTEDGFLGAVAERTGVRDRDVLLRALRASGYSRSYYARAKRKYGF
ncbi:MAG: methyltransferase domain-containing protein [Candidatus Diapherotrites archaeon]|nr:methyltransferase domain-containing protein [Candidatus Diapherotrites archaeon]